MVTILVAVSVNVCPDTPARIISFTWYVPEFAKVCLIFKAYFVYTVSIPSPKVQCHWVIWLTGMELSVNVTGELAHATGTLWIKLADMQAGRSTSCDIVSAQPKLLVTFRLT